jgi:FeS assembly SUF system protein
MDQLTKNPIKLDDREAPGEAPAAEAAAPPPPSPEAADTAGLAKNAEELEGRIVAALKTVFDPEIPVDVYELGLIYDIAVGEVDDAGEYPVQVKMTLTSPACPVAGSLPGEVEQKVASVQGVERAEVELVWDPTWNPSMMSEAARLELGFF